MWNIAQAKQQFSEVVRQAEVAPQPIMRHSKEVAVLISARDFEEFKAWRAGQSGQQKTAGQRFLDGLDDIRQILMDADPHYQGIELPERLDRPNAIDAMLGTHFPYGENADGSARSAPH